MDGIARLYGAAIALVSGGYSLWQATAGPEIGIGGWLMIIVGVVVLAHGVVLVLDERDRLGNANGPLMVGYAVVMLLIQGLREADMLGGDGMGMPAGMGPGWDPGMVALAVLMFVSGVIMLRSDGRGRRM